MNRVNRLKVRSKNILQIYDEYMKVSYYYKFGLFSECFDVLLENVFFFDIYKIIE